jgi:hypothetical protein
MTDSTLITPPGEKSRCPICDHPSTVTLKSDDEELPPQVGGMRHRVSFSCDKGHGWTTTWTTDGESA